MHLHASTSDYHVVIDQAAFQRALSNLFKAAGFLCIAIVRQRATVNGCELVIANWTVAVDVPATLEAQQPSALALMVLAGGTHRAIISDLFRRIPAWQTLIRITIDPHRPDTLGALICVGGRLYGPASVRFIGAGMATIVCQTDQSMRPTGSDPAELALRELRVSRTRGALQGLSDRCARSSVLQVGDGSGGAELFRQLAACNPKQMTVVGPSRIGVENLNNMPLAGQSDAERKRLKVDVIVAAAHRNQPDMHVVGLPYRVQDPEIVDYIRRRRFDVLFSWADHDAAALATSLLALEMHAVHIAVGSLVTRSAAAYESRVDIRLFEPGRGCVACTPALPNLDEVLYELRRPRHTLRGGVPQSWDTERAGSLLHVNAFAASLAVDLWLRYLAGEVRTSHWIRVGWPFGGTPVVSEGVVAGDPGCRFCRQLESARQP